VSPTLPDTVVADESGAWTYTLHTVLGTVTVTATQHYALQTGNVAEQTSAVYKVGPILSLEFTTDGPTATTMTVHGLPGAIEHGYRVVYRSSVAEVNGEKSYVRDGGNRIHLNVPVEAITAPIEHWLQVDDQVGPVQVWTP